MGDHVRTSSPGNSTWTFAPGSGVGSPSPLSTSRRKSVPTLCTLRTVASLRKPLSIRSIFPFTDMTTSRAFSRHPVPTATHSSVGRDNAGPVEPPSGLGRVHVQKADLHHARSGHREVEAVLRDVHPHVLAEARGAHRHGHLLTTAGFGLNPKQRIDARLDVRSDPPVQLPRSLRDADAAREIEPGQPALRAGDFPERRLRVA